MKFEDNRLNTLGVMTHQTWISGKAIRPLFAEPVTIIEPQTVCGLKKIEQKTINMQRKNQQCVIIMRWRITNKIPLLPDKQFRRIH